MAYRKGYRKPYVPGAKGPAPQKLVRVAWRESLDVSRFREEDVVSTGYSIDDLGVLTMFCSGSVIWTLAPGYWRGVVLIGEVPVLESGQTVEVQEEDEQNAM
jgi:hypothetical protein